MNPSYARYLAPTVSASVLLLLLVYLVPWVPEMPGRGLDPSWTQSLNQALSQRLTFGTDLIFTFGPFGALYSRVYHPDTYALILTASLVLTLAYWGILQLLWGSQPLKLALMGAVTASSGRFDDPALLLYPLLVAISLPLLLQKRLVWGWALALAPMGLLALTKGTALLLGGSIAGVLGLYLAGQKKIGWALTTLVAPLVAAAVAWVLAGQPPGSAIQYLQSILEVSSGYSQAMSSTGPSHQIATYLVLAGVLLAATVPWRQPSVLGWVMVASLALYLWVAFKIGFVRHDNHYLVAASALLPAMLVIAFRQRLWWPYLIGWLVLGLSSNFVGSALLEQYRILSSRVSQISNSIASGEPSLPQRYAETLKATAAQHPLPLVAGSADIYAYEQSALIASGNRWNPRPIFQSYAAYTPRLAQFNRQHLLKPDRPDYLFFRVETIDSRLPSLDDGASWPVILTNYQPVQWAGQHLLLQAKSSQPVEPVVEEVSRSRHQFGDWVRLPQQTPQPIFVRLDIQPTLPGRLANLAFKSSSLDIHLELVTGETRRFRINSAQARSGFLLSPHVADTTDFAALITGQSPNHKRVRAFSLHTSPLGYQLWQPSFEVTLQHFQFVPSPLPPSLAALQPLPSTPLTPTRLVPTTCAANLDQLNDRAPGPQVLFDSFNLAGWFTRSLRPAALPQLPVGLLIAADGRSSLFALQTTKRPDVATHFGEPLLQQSGISATVTINHLPNASYTLALGNQLNDRVEVCTSPQINVEVANYP